MKYESGQGLILAIWNERKINLYVKLDSFGYICRCEQRSPLCTFSECLRLKLAFPMDIMTQIQSSLFKFLFGFKLPSFSFAWWLNFRPYTSAYEPLQLIYTITYILFLHRLDILLMSIVRSRRFF